MTGTRSRLAAFVATVVVAGACSGGDNTVVIDGTPGPEETTIATTTATTMAPDEVVDEQSIDRAPVDRALDQFSVALSEGDYEVAGELLAYQSLHFFDLILALSELGEPEEFDRSPFIAAVLAAVLRGWEGRPETAQDAFAQLGSLGQIPFPPESSAIEWLEVEPGVLFGLVDQFAFVTMRLEDGAWKVDMTQLFIRAETARRETMQAQTGLGEDAPASAFIFEPFGFVEPEPPFQRSGGAMGALPAPAWSEFLRAVDSRDWTEAYGMVGSVTLLEDTSRIVAFENARQNAISADATQFAEMPFADALLALTLRASFDRAALEAMEPADIFGIALESGVARLSTTESDLVWSTTSGIRFLGSGTFDGAGVFRRGDGWFVDGNVIAGSVPGDFFSTSSVDPDDQIGQVLAALNQITGGTFDLSLLTPLG